MNWSYMGYFAIGFGIGSIAGIFMEVGYEKWQEKRTLEKMDAEIQERLESDASYSYPEKDEMEINTITSSYVMINEDGNVMSDGLKEIKVSDITDYAKKYMPEDVEERVIVTESEYEERKAKSGGSEQERSRQEIITEQDYYIQNGFQKVECTYAQDDDMHWVLTNDVDNEEMNVEETIGIASLSEFVDTNGGEGEPCGILYVRNSLKGVDYFVTKFAYEE